MIVVRNVKVFKYGTIVEVFVTTLALPFHMKASWLKINARPTYSRLRQTQS